ncbi:MAG: PQQ-binding-like beta-propeller repeat protein [Rhodopirellula sp.]|nr:PQQ-binding-like beta-propeller repeat protein [Rhodopirellula sp.]
MPLKCSSVWMLLCFPFAVSAADWPQAAGPDGNFVVDGQAVDRFSVATNQNVVWRSPLPSTGQGTPIVSNSRVFVTSHEPITRDTETGSMILGMCFDAATGKELWRREIPGTRETDLSSLFSDNTAASPVADGERVLFSNVGGALKCFNFDGVEQWQYQWGPFGRHHARQHEPILYNSHAILVQVPREDLQREVTTKAGAAPLGRGEEYWTRLQAFDLKTGKRDWIAEVGTSCHSTSLIGRRADGTMAILTGRGGGHQPPEEPYGLSLINADDGKTIWDLPIQSYAAHQSASWNQDVACLFAGKEHLTVDIQSGKIQNQVSVVEGVTIRRHTADGYKTEMQQTLKKARSPLTKQGNCLIGNYHYFRAHDEILIGRVNIQSGSVEYLQIPVQVIRRKDVDDEVRWTQPLKNDMKNADGFVATQDKRNGGSGWGHVSAASPIVVGEHLYIPTMIGMVYVLKWNAETLDENALVSISDLGPAGETWSLSSLSFSDGKLYARTLKELICLGTAK